MGNFGSRKLKRMPDRPERAAVALTLLVNAETTDGETADLSSLAEGCLGVMPVFGSEAEARVYLDRIGSTAVVVMVEATT